MIIKIEARYIPDGTIVRKPNGVFSFTLKKNIRIFNNTSNDKNNQIEIDVPNGAEVNYLINNRGDISMINSSKMLEIDIVDGQFKFLKELYEIKFGEVGYYD